MDWYTEIIKVIKMKELPDGSNIDIYRNDDVTLKFIVRENAGNYYLDFPDNKKLTVH